MTTATKQYRYATDSEWGTLEAADFDAAIDQLHALVPERARLDGGYGWVEDCDAPYARYAIDAMASTEEDEPMATFVHTGKDRWVSASEAVSGKAIEFMLTGRSF